MVPPKLYKIGEVMRYSGLSRQTVHNYTVMGLVSEAERTPSGHRLYDGRVFARLARIRDLKERLTLQEIKRLLDDENGSANGSANGDGNGEANGGLDGDEPDDGAARGRPVGRGTAGGDREEVGAGA